MKPTSFFLAAAAGLLVAGIPPMLSAAPLPTEQPAAVSLRTITDLNQGWRFIQKDLSEALQPGFDDSGLRLLNLPHDWTVEGDYSPDNPSGGSCGYLPGGIGIYRKTVVFPKAQFSNGRRLWLEFDGVFRNSDVYVNGKHMGRRDYGWISFGYDITDALKPDGTANIAVRVDNRLEPAARWYTGSGIYADVTAISLAPLHIARHGLYITTPEISETRASIRIAAELSADASDARLEYTVLSPEGKTVAAASAQPGAPLLLSLPKPSLWSPDTPALYTLKATLLQNNRPTDTLTQRFGIRSLRFDAKEGFFLNGIGTKLRGVADHWAVGALGAAVPKNVMRSRILQLKRMGCNAIRTAHNPRPPFFYDICDELGMLVMNEMFDGWHGKAKHDYGRYSFTQDWEKDITEWVKRDRNHPSVILWSIGNETGLRDINGIAQHITSLDNSRATTGGGVTVGVDVVGINGPSEDIDFRQPDPTRPFVATEAPHTWQVRGMYETQTWYRDGPGKRVVKTPNLTPTEIFSYDWEEHPRYKRGLQSSYDNAYVRTPARYNWAVTRDTPWRMGEFRWTGYDYLGEASYVSGGYPYKLFTSGAIDCANFEKDLYYLYQSQWTSPATAPMVHILPSWTHPTMKPGTNIPVWVYSNCETVELFKDGQSLGKVTRGPTAQRPWDKMQFAWLIPWAPGTLKAVGSRPDGKPVAEETFRTAGAPADLHLSAASRGCMPANPYHVEEVTLRLTDTDGNFYPYGENRTYVAVTGPASIKAIDSGSPVDVERHAFTDNRRAFMGLNKVFVQTEANDAPVLLTAGAILGERRSLTSDIVTIRVGQLPLRGTPVRPPIQITYTLDGSEPTAASRPYTTALKIRQGTTVRALVLSDGKPLFSMTETFGPDRGLCWNTVETSATAEPPAANLSKAPSVILQPACIGKNTRIGLTPNNREVRLYDTEHIGPYAFWHVVDLPNGSACLVSHREKKYLAVRNGSLVLTRRPSKQTEWNINGDREGFDYIQHRTTGKRLGLSPDAKTLILLPGSYGKDDDFSANRAYWHLVPVNKARQ